MPAALGAVVTGAGAGFGGALVSTIVSVGISYISKKMFSPSIDQTTEQQSEGGILSNRASNSDPIPVIYGYRRVGGTSVFKTVTNSNKDLWMAIVIGEGEINGIRKMRINDTEVDFASGDKSGGVLLPDTLLEVTSSQDVVSVSELESGKDYRILAVNTEDWSSYRVDGNTVSHVGDTFEASSDATSSQLTVLGNVGQIVDTYGPSDSGQKRAQFVYRTGTSAQTAITGTDFGDTTNFPSDWDSDKRLIGLSYVLCRFTYDRESFSGIPTVTFDVEGVKVPKKPTGSPLAIPATKEFSRNPALIMLDYLTNPTYGRGLSESLIDLSTFADAADTCDETFTQLDLNDDQGKTIESQLGLTGANKYRLYRCDGVVNTDDSTYENTKKILSSMRAYLIFSAGKYKLKIDKFEPDYSRQTVLGASQTPTTIPFLFNEDNMIGQWNITLGDKSNTFNRARYQFYNPQKNWATDTQYEDDPTSRKNEDNGLVLEQNVPFDFVAGASHAKSIARQNLKQSRQQISVGFLANISALENEVGDIVEITHPHTGWTNKQFRLLKMELQEDGNVKVVMMEYNPEVYNLETINFINDAPDTSLPNPFYVSTTPEEPTATDANLSGKTDAGTAVQIGRVKVAWEPVVDPFIDYYELQYSVLDQEGSTVSAVTSGSVYKVVSVSDVDWSSVGGPDATVADDVFKATSSTSVASLGTVKLMTEDSAGYSTVTVPTIQLDSNSDAVEYIENLSPKTGYAFRVRYVRTNSVYSDYSPVHRFVTAGVTSAVGASYLNVIEVTAGNPEMQDNVGTVTYKSFLLKGGEKSPDMGDTDSEINSYDWFYTVSGGTKTQITNANKATVTGSTANNSSGGSGTNYNAATLTVEADGTALGTTGSGSVTFSCEIDYTPT